MNFDVSHELIGLECHHPLIDDSSYFSGRGGNPWPSSFQFWWILQWVFFWWFQAHHKGGSPSNCWKILSWRCSTCSLNSSKHFVTQVKLPGKLFNPLFLFAETWIIGLPGYHISFSSNNLMVSHGWITIYMAYWWVAHPWETMKVEVYDRTWSTCMG